MPKEECHGRSAEAGTRAYRIAGDDARLRCHGIARRPRARPTTDEQAETILNAVLDAGINYIDTSIDYGVSEERIGRYISHRRSEYYLASKCGCLVGAATAPVGQVSPHVYTRDNIIAGVEQSLVRMKTDYLDLVQFHISPSKQTLEENGSLDAMMELKEAGKVRFIGMSGTLPHLKDHIAMGVFDVFQIPYSAMEREHEAVIAAASEAGAGIVIRGGAAKGAPSDGKAAGAAMGAMAAGQAGGPAWRYDRRWSSSSALPSAILIWTPPLSERRTRRTFRTMSRSCGKGRCRWKFTPKPSAVLPMPALRQRVRDRLPDDE